MRRTLPVNSRAIDPRRARWIVAATAMLLGAILWTASAHAQGCGEQRDMLVASDPLAPVRPNDCASLLAAAPDFTWPAQHDAHGYSIALTFPDGHVETRSASRNWLAWPQALPPGEYRWTVRVNGAREASAARSFTIDRLASPALVPARAASGKVVAVD